MRSARTLGCAIPPAFAFALALSLTGCVKPDFTEGVRARFALTPADIQRIQFYTSQEIVLQREVADQSKVVSGSGLAIRDGVRVEEVDIPAHTACVALRVEGDYILVSFSRQHPDRALWFGLKKTDDRLAADLHEFQLVQLENPVSEPGPFRPLWSKGFLVSYGGLKYRVVDGDAWSAHLLYDLEQSFAKKKVREEPPGWHISDEPAPKMAPPAAAVSTSASATSPPAPAPVPSSVANAPDAGGKN